MKLLRGLGKKKDKSANPASHLTGNLAGNRSQKSSPIMATSTTVHAITNTQIGLTQDQRHRQRAYFASMMVRTFCFIAAIVLHNPYRPFAIAGALILPYVAVVMANAGKERPSESNAFVLHQPRKSLPNLSDL